MKQPFLNGIFALIFGLSLQSFATINSIQPLLGTSLGDGCAQIVLKTGDVISADVTQITENTILYKPCGEKNAEPIRIDKSKILKIKAPNGEVIFNGAGKTMYANGETQIPKTNGLAVAGFVCSLFGILGILGLIFSLVALNQIKESPGKYTGEGLAIAGAIISGLTLLLLIILLGLRG
jgi:hypothetical protein